MAGQFAKNSFYVALSGLCNAFSTFASTVIIARCLGLSATGIVAFAVWLSAMIVMTADLGIGISVARFMTELRASGDREGADRLAGWLCRWFSIPSFCLPILVLVAIRLYGDRSGGGFASASMSTLCLTAVLCIFQSLSSFGLSYLQGSQQFQRAARITLLSFLAQISVLIVGSLYMGVDGALLGYIVGNVIPAALVVSAIRRDTALPDPLKRRVKRYAIYSWAIAIVSAFVFSRLELVFLEHFWGSQAVALFAVALTISSLSTQGPLLLARGTFFYFSEQLGKGNTAGVIAILETGTRLIAFLVFPLCLLAAAIMPLLLPMIYGSSFSGAVQTAQILVSASALVTTTTIAANLMLALDRNDFLFRCGLIGAVFSVLFGFTLIPAYGILGAAIGRAVVQIALTIPGLWYVASRFNIRFPFGSLAKLAIAALASAFLARACIDAMPGLYGFPIALTAAAGFYLASVRLLGALPKSDASLLQQTLSGFPTAIRTVPVAALRLICVNA